MCCTDVSKPPRERLKIAAYCFQKLIFFLLNFYLSWKPLSVFIPVTCMTASERLQTLSFSPALYLAVLCDEFNPIDSALWSPEWLMKMALIALVIYWDCSRWWIQRLAQVITSPTLDKGEYCMLNRHAWGEYKSASSWIGKRRGWKRKPPGTIHPGTRLFWE